MPPADQHRVSSVDALSTSFELQSVTCTTATAVEIEHDDACSNITQEHKPQDEDHAELQSTGNTAVAAECTTPQPLTQPSPSSDIPSDPELVRRYAKALNKGFTYVLGPAMLIIAAVTFWPTLAAKGEGKLANEYAAWTARKDFLEFCADKVQRQTNPSCALASNTTLPPPPHFIDHAKRSLETAVNAFKQDLFNPYRITNLSDGKRLLVVCISSLAVGVLVTPLFLFAVLKKDSRQAKRDQRSVATLSPDTHVHHLIPKCEIPSSELRKRINSECIEDVRLENDAERTATDDNGVKAATRIIVHHDGVLESRADNVYDIMWRFTWFSDSAALCKLLFVDGLVKLKLELNNTSASRDEMLDQLRTASLDTSHCDVLWENIPMFYIELRHEKQEHGEGRSDRLTFSARNHAEALEIVRLLRDKSQQEISVLVPLEKECQSSLGKQRMFFEVRQKTPLVTAAQPPTGTLQIENDINVSPYSGIEVAKSVRDVDETVDQMTAETQSLGVSTISSDSNIAPSFVNDAGSTESGSHSVYIVRFKPSRFSVGRLRSRATRKFEMTVDDLGLHLVRVNMASPAIRIITMSEVLGVRVTKSNPRCFAIIYTKPQLSAMKRVTEEFEAESAGTANKIVKDIKWRSRSPNQHPTTSILIASFESSDNDGPLDLILRKDQILKVAGPFEDQRCLLARTDSGDAGLVPRDHLIFLDKAGYENPPSLMELVGYPHAVIALADYEVEPYKGSEFNASKGEILQIKNIGLSWWHAENFIGQTGTVSSTYFNLLDGCPETGRRNDSQASNTFSHKYAHKRRPNTAFMTRPSTACWEYLRVIFLRSAF
ncbi:MAG: hypothetical protein M1820_001509 [Bogoriella megaspora]|nr:MAG: hypothetical protein M1820_001509 [Bogoriella megaspora]